MKFATQNSRIYFRLESANLFFNPNGENGKVKKLITILAVLGLCGSGVQEAKGIEAEICKTCNIKNPCSIRSACTLFCECDPTEIAQNHSVRTALGNLWHQYTYQPTPKKALQCCQKCAAILWVQWETAIYTSEREDTNHKAMDTYYMPVYRAITEALQKVLPYVVAETSAIDPWGAETVNALNRLKLSAAVLTEAATTTKGWRGFRRIIKMGSRFFLKTNESTFRKITVHTP